MSFSYAVSNARPAPIDDRLLGQLTQVAHDAPRSMASEAECEWLLSTIGPLLDELKARRAAMARMDIPLETSNVIALPSFGGSGAR